MWDGCSVNFINGTCLKKKIKTKAKQLILKKKKIKSTSRNCYLDSCLCGKPLLLPTLDSSIMPDLNPKILFEFNPKPDTNQTRK